MNGVFQLDAYQIESVTVVQNAKFNAALPAHTGDISSAINIAPHKSDDGKFRLTLELQVKPTARKEAEFFAYQVAIRGRAFFTFETPCSHEEAGKTLRLNGAAILFGLLRAQVAQITAQSVHGQFLLPIMNFVELERNRGASQVEKTDRKP